MTTDRDLIRKLLAVALDETKAETPRQERAPYEGAAKSPAICHDCGFSLSDPGPCPKCGCGKRDLATAFVRRDLSELLEKHQAVQSTRQATAAKPAPPGSPLATAAQKRPEKRAESAQAVKKKGRPRIPAPPTRSPLEAARATGKPCTSVEWKRAYMKVWNRDAWAKLRRRALVSEL